SHASPGEENRGVPGGGGRAGRRSGGGGACPLQADTRVGAVVMRSKPVKARAALLGACAIVCGMATGAMAQGQPTGGLSDKSVATIMHYAWQILPTKFTAPS